MFKKKEQPVWKKRTRFLRADEFVCSACGAASKKARKVCPNCGAKLAGVFNENAWIEEEEEMMWLDE